MAYTVTITYAGPANPSDLRIPAPIYPIYVPSNSYVDTAAYDGTVYDTNVKGFGYINVMEPYATTNFPFPVPLAQFKVAVVGESNEVTFTVETYMEAFYYMEAGRALASQGFKTKRFVSKILANRLADFVSSDAHDTVKRPPKINCAYERIVKKYGKEYADKICFENAKQMIFG